MNVTTREKARLLRQQQTAAEQLLWQQLRNRRLAGYRFQRQFAIGFYIVDFICRAEKLIVELDGAHHAEADQIAYDEERTQFLAAQDFRVLRFWNGEVETAMPDVLHKIEAVLNTLTPQTNTPAASSRHFLPEKKGEQDKSNATSSLLSPSSFGRGVGVRVSP